MNRSHNWQIVGQAGLSVLFLLFLSILSFGQSLSRGPYLMMPTPTSMTIRWRTEEEGKGLVRYGLSLDNLSLQTRGTPTTEHEVTLRQLAPNTRYYYSVEVDGKVLASGANFHFTTVAATENPALIRFWALGDCGSANQEQEDVRDAYGPWNGALRPNFMLFLGDNAYGGGTDDEYQLGFFDVYRDIFRQIPIWSCIGNHDMALTFNESAYYQIFTFPTAGECGGTASGNESYYSFDHGPLHVIVLDAMGASYRPDTGQREWLIEDLSRTQKPWIVACWHHPPYSHGSHDSDQEDDLRKMREVYVPILEAGGCDLVLCGHSHRYERSQLLYGQYGHSSTYDAESHAVQIGYGPRSGVDRYPKLQQGRGTAYVVSGSASSVDGGVLRHPVMVHSVPQLGSMMVEIAGDEMKVVFVPIPGEPGDEFVIRHQANVTSPPTRPSGVVLRRVIEKKALLRWDWKPAVDHWQVFVKPINRPEELVGRTSGDENSILLDFDVLLVPNVPPVFNLRIVAVNAYGNHGTPSTTFELDSENLNFTDSARWRFVEFGTAEMNATTEDLADPDADGLVNLMEYALGSHPLAPGTLHLPSAELRQEDGELLFTFNRLARRDLVYSVEIAPTIAGPWTTPFTTRGAENLPGRVTVASGKGVARLKVERLNLP